jgi:hypothetical protein
LGHERFDRKLPTSWGKLAGIGVTVLGALIMVAFSRSGGSSSVSKNFGLGLFYTAIQVTFGGAMHPVQKALLNRGYDSVVVVAWSYLWGTGLLLLCVLTGATAAADWAVTPLAAAAIAYAAVLSSAVAYGLMGYVNATVNPAMVAAFVPLQGVMTAVIAWAALGESLGPAAYAGGGVVCAGLLLTCGCRYAESLRAAPAAADGGGGDGGFEAAGVLDALAADAYDDVDAAKRRLLYTTARGATHAA